MKRLSNLLSELKPAYDVVIVGSGYGGSIAASRMARCGLSVCLLEKGKEFLPGDFPDSQVEAAKEMQVATGKKHIGPENGLYEMVVGKDISVFKGCGLGGTSLVNANVSIEAEERVFDDPRWPQALRKDRQGLDMGIARARQMLRPTPYPEQQNGYPVLAKTAAMRKSAKAMGESFQMLDINVNFQEHRNHVGVQQYACNNCGDCVTGCNQGAKNTTAMNYLPDAKNHGAEIFTEVAVRHVEKQEQGWLVYFDMLGADRHKFDAPPLFVRAQKVFLSAGSLGSTEILLRSSAQGLEVSDMLGQRFTGNGDVLGFGYNCDESISGMGKRVLNGKPGDVGPCITSAIDMRKREKLEDGMTLEEGSIPSGIAKIVLGSIVHFNRLFGIDTDKNFGDFLKEKWREIQSRAQGPYTGAMNNTQVYLVMTHDDGKGKMSLKDDRINIEWKGVGKQDIFQKVGEKLEAATKALGGTFIKNPTYNKLLNYDLVTVHPLGGCVMGEDAASGVVDHKGQVFAGKQGDKLYDGLYVQDGAIIPRSVGTNPLLTISGLVERNCQMIAREMGFSLDYAFPEIADNPEPPAAVGVQFTETMRGYFSTKEKEDYEKGRELGENASSPFEFTLTIQIADIGRFVNEPEHEGGMIGTVKAPALSKLPLSVSEGCFNLFVQDQEDASRKKMLYRMKMHSVEGKTYYFEGFKDIHDDKGLDMWSDTTQLYITIHDGDSENSAVLGKGKLHIAIADFSKQMTTMKAIRPRNKVEGLKAVAQFGKLFAGEVWDTYAG
jgi:cholesterol oxidase